MNFKSAAVLTMIVGICPPGAASAAGLDEKPMPDGVLAESRAITLPLTALYQPQLKRPVLLPALYVTLGAMQAWDLHSTSAAIRAGAHEANPVAALATSNGSLLGLKVATTASTIFFAERVWKKNRVAAVVMMTAINGATAAVAMHNMRNARTER